MVCNLSYSPTKSLLLGGWRLYVASSMSNLPAGLTMKQVGEWKDHSTLHDVKTLKLWCLVCRKAIGLLLSEKGLGRHRDRWGS